MRTTYGAQKSRFRKVVNLLALTTLPHASSYKLRTHHGTFVSRDANQVPIANMPTRSGLAERANKQRHGLRVN